MSFPALILTPSNATVGSDQLYPEMKSVISWDEISVAPTDGDGSGGDGGGE